MQLCAKSQVSVDTQELLKHFAEEKQSFLSRKAETQKEVIPRSEIASSLKFVDCLRSCRDLFPSKVPNC